MPISILLIYFFWNFRRIHLKLRIICKLYLKKKNLNSRKLNHHSRCWPGNADTRTASWGSSRSISDIQVGDRKISGSLELSESGVCLCMRRRMKWIHWRARANREEQGNSETLSCTRRTSFLPCTPTCAIVAKNGGNAREDGSPQLQPESRDLPEVTCHTVTRRYQAQRNQPDPNLVLGCLGKAAKANTRRGQALAIFPWQVTRPNQMSPVNTIPIGNHPGRKYLSAASN